METIIKGYLTLEKNKDLVSEGVSLGNNNVTHLIVTVVAEEVRKINTIIAQYNKPDSPIERHYSMPVAFESTPAGPTVHVKCVIRAAKSDSLMKLIDWSSSLLKVPVASWVGAEVAVTVKLNKYDFSIQPNSSEDLKSGGARQKVRGISFTIKSIKRVSEIPN